MSKERESGFYWCKRGDWMVCPWNGDHWIIPGYNPFMKYSDSDFTEIDERPIDREDSHDVIPLVPEHKLRGLTKNE